LTPAQVAAGVFYFHSCLRLTMNAVAGETVLANQDGDREQENIDYFQVPPDGPRSRHVQSLSIRNDDLTRPKHVILGYRLTTPNSGADDWRVELNNGVPDITLAPGELRQIPVEIIPGSLTNRQGQRYLVDVFGLIHHTLVNNLNPSDQHNEFRFAGGARIEALVVVPTNLSCSATVSARGTISVTGQLRRAGGAASLPILAVGWSRQRGFIESSRVLMKSDRIGQFRGLIRENRDDAIERVDCFFAGTTELSSAVRNARLIR